MLEPGLERELLTFLTGFAVTLMRVGCGRGDVLSTGNDKLTAAMCIGDDVLTSLRLNILSWSSELTLVG